MTSVGAEETHGCSDAGCLQKWWSHSKVRKVGMDRLASVVHSTRRIPPRLYVGRISGAENRLCAAAVWTPLII